MFYRLIFAYLICILPGLWYASEYINIFSYLLITFFITILFVLVNYHLLISFNRNLHIFGDELIAFKALNKLLLLLFIGACLMYVSRHGLTLDAFLFRSRDIRHEYFASSMPWYVAVFQSYWSYIPLSFLSILCISSPFRAKSLSFLFAFAIMLDAVNSSRTNLAYSLFFSIFYYFVVYDTGKLGNLFKYILFAIPLLFSLLIGQLSESVDATNSILDLLRLRVAAYIGSAPLLSAYVDTLGISGQINELLWYGLSTPLSLFGISTKLPPIAYNFIRLPNGLNINVVFTNQVFFYTIEGCILFLFISIVFVCVIKLIASFFQMPKYIITAALVSFLNILSLSFYSPFVNSKSLIGFLSVLSVYGLFFLYERYRLRLSKFYV